MSLRDKIQQDIDQALKKGEKQKLTVLRFLRAQIKDQEIAQERRELSDEEMIKLISKQIKKLKKSLPFFEKGKREDLIEKTKREIKILSLYLPEEF